MQRHLSILSILQRQGDRDVYLVARVKREGRMRARIVVTPRTSQSIHRRKQLSVSVLIVEIGGRRYMWIPKEARCGYKRERERYRVKAFGWY